MASPAPSSLAAPGRTSRRSSLRHSGVEKLQHGGQEREKGELRSQVDVRDLSTLRLKAQETTRVPMPLKKGAMATQLRETISKMRAQVDALMSHQDRHRSSQDAPESGRPTLSKSKTKKFQSPRKTEPESTVRRKCAGAPPDADQSLAKLREMHEKNNRVPLVKDDSEDSSNEEGTSRDEEEAGVPGSDEEEDFESQDDQADDEVLGRDAVAAAIAADQAAQEHWDADAARDHVQELLSTLHVEERVHVLEDLKHHFQDQLESIQDDSEKINTLEHEATQEMASISEAANNLTSSIDDREHLAYRSLWNYYITLQHQIRGIPKERKENLEELREQLLAHARRQQIDKLTGKSNDRSVNEMLNIKRMLPEGVTPAEVLAAVASAQDQITLLKECIEFDLRRKAGYEHTLNLVMKEGLERVVHDEIATQVIQDVRQWTQDRVNNEATKHLHHQLQSRASELEKLNQECEMLRMKVESQEKEAVLHVDHMKGGKADPSSQDARMASMLSSGSDKSQYNLFTEDASKSFRKEFRALHEENAKVEEQLAQFQELESLAKTAVTVLQDNTERFVEAAAQARRNLQVGSLPDEAEEDGESKLLKELKGIDENLIKKQDEDHKAEMQKLEAKEAQLRAEIATAEEERGRLEVQIEKERKRQEHTLTEILGVEARQKEAQEELDKLPLPDLTEGEQKLERLKAENERLSKEVEDARRNLGLATRRKELNGQALDQSRDLAAKLLTAAKKGDEVNIDDSTLEDSEQRKDEDDCPEEAWKSLHQMAIKQVDGDNDEDKEEVQDGKNENDSKDEGKDVKDEAGEKQAESDQGHSLEAFLAMKKSAHAWKSRAKTAVKASAEVQKYLDEEHRDNEEAAKYQAKTLRLHKQIAAMEAWAKQAKNGVMLPDLPQEEATPEVLHLRKQVKSKKKELQGMRAHWWNVRELAKRGARIPTGKEAIDIRNAIVSICDEALLKTSHRNSKDDSALVEVGESSSGIESMQRQSSNGIESSVGLSSRPESSIGFESSFGTESTQRQFSYGNESAVDSELQRPESAGGDAQASAEAAEVTKNHDVGSTAGGTEAAPKDNRTSKLLDVLLG